MSESDLDARLSALFESILGLPKEQVTDETSPDTTPAWDSVAHLNLVISIEETFAVSFTPEETMEMTTVRLIKLLLEEKLGS
jgi:acyl carrier protein